MFFFVLKIRVMKMMFARLALICSVLTGGCSKQENTPASPPVPPASSKEGDSLATAPVDYLARVGKAGQAMEKKLDTVSLNSAVELFNAQEGRFPKDLNELVEKKYLGKLPAPPFGMKLQYDPKEGKVSVVKQ